MAINRNFEDKKVVKAVNLIWWLLILNFCFVITILPLIFVFLFVSIDSGTIFYILLNLASISMGPALLAVFNIVGKIQRNDEIDIVKSYFKTYKTNIIEGLFYWMFYLMAFNIIYFDLDNVRLWQNGQVIHAILVILLFVLISMLFYTFPIISRFNLSFKEVISLSFWSSIKHMNITVLNIMTIFVLLFLVTKVIGSMILILGSISCFFIYSYEIGFLDELGYKIEE